MRTKHKMNIKTDEPITITLEPMGNYCDGTVVKVDGHDYACFQSLNLNEIDTDHLRDWIENTYYDGDYKSSAYIPCDLRSEEFEKVGEDE